jgi:hypothetical protein
MFKIAVVTDSDPCTIQSLLESGNIVFSVDCDELTGCLISSDEKTLNEAGKLLGLDTRNLLSAGGCFYLEVTTDIEALVEIMKSKPNEFTVSEEE